MMRRNKDSCGNILHFNELLVPHCEPVLRLGHDDHDAQPETWRVLLREVQRHGNVSGHRIEQCDVSPTSDRRDKCREILKMFHSETRNVEHALRPIYRFPWWRHQMETTSALLVICAGNSSVPGEFPAQRPVTRSFDFFLCSASE